MDEPFDRDHANDATAHQRGQPRDAMFLQAKLRHVERDEELVLRVRNLSAGGMMAECTQPFGRGDAVEVELRGIGTVAGTIAWAREGRIGVAFAQAINPKLARKPVGGTNKLVVKAPSVVLRRPGLRID